MESPRCGASALLILKLALLLAICNAGTTIKLPRAMSRRTYFVIVLIVLAALATTVAPWTLSSGGFAASVADQLHDGYGIDLQVRGRSTFALLPVPRMKFEDVTLSSSDGAIRAEGGTLRGELRVVSLLRGRIELSEVSLADSRITLADKVVQSLDLGRAVALFGEQN